MTPEEQIALLEKQLKQAQQDADAWKTKCEQQKQEAESQIAMEKARAEARIEQIESKAQRKLDRAKERVQKKDEAMKKLLKETEHDRAMAEIAPHILAVLIESCTVIQELAPNDPFLQSDIIKELSKKEQEDWEVTLNDKMLKALFIKGSEKTTAAQRKQEYDEMLNTATPIVRTVDRNLNMAGRVVTNITKGAALAAEDAPDDELLQQAKKVVAIASPETEKATRRPSPGRQRVKPKELPPTPVAEAVTACSQCSSRALTRSKPIELNLRTMEMLISRLVHHVNKEYLVVRCEDCGRVHLEWKHPDVPVRPTGTLGQSVVITAAVANAIGTPLHKTQEMLFDKDSKFGHSTLGRNIHEWCEDYGAPLLDKIAEELNRQEVVVADETRISVLQSKHQGVCAPKKDSKTRQHDYIGVQCSVYGHPKRCVKFGYLGSRGKDAIHDFLKDLQCKVLVTDAYAVYDSFCQAHTDIKHQCCFTHLRREIMNAVNFGNLKEKYGNLPDDQFIEMAKENAVKGSHLQSFCSVISAINKIYGYEKTVKPKPNESREDFLERRRKMRAGNPKQLVEIIDKTMVLLAAQLTIKQGNKLYEAKDKTLQTGAAVVYYMNHREAFRRFLDDPEIPMDSNSVEYCIRSVAVLRKATDHKQSQEYTKSLCTLLSLTETAKANGIRDITGWLLDFGRAYFLYRARASLQTRIDAGGKLDTKLRSFDAKSADGFDFERWLPWNYQKTTPQA